MDSLLQGSWQPKLFAVLGLIASLANAGVTYHAGGHVDTNALFIQISTCVGLFTARQNNKSSEQVGAGNTGPNQGGK